MWTPTGSVTTFRSNRVPALLGLLVTKPGMHPRHQVARTLWPEADDQVALHNLRQTLVYLRATLGDIAEESIQATRASLGLNQGVLTVDVDVLLATERYHPPEAKHRLFCEAVDMVQGPFLPGIDDPWIRDERSHLSQVFVRALLFLADSEMDASPSRALEYSQRAVLEEPLLDGARARKIRALIRCGEKVAAQLEYEAFADLLDQELGITPSDIVREALNDQPHNRFQPIGKDSPSVSGDLSFALDTLGLGDKPYLAVNLAVSVTPHWIQVGTPRLGMDKLLEALARAGSNLSDRARAEAIAALAELSLAKGDVSGCEQYLDELGANCSGHTERTKFKILHCRAWLNLTRLDGKSAIESAKSAMLIAQAARDSNLELDALGLMSTAALYCPDFVSALESADRALTLAKRLGRSGAVASALLSKAQACEELENNTEAEEFARTTMQVLSGSQTAASVSMKLTTSRLLENLGHLEEAEAGYRQGLQALQGFENPIRESIALTFLGDLVQSTGKPREAIALHTKALALRREISHSLGIATSLRGLGKAYSDLGELHAAREALLEAAHLYLNEDMMPGYASVLLALAVVEEKSAHRPLAARLARRALKLLRGMTRFEKKMIGRSGLSAASEAEQLLARCV